MLNQLVTTGDAVSVEVQDGNAQGGAGGLVGAGKGEKKTANSGTRALFKCGYVVESPRPLQKEGTHCKRKPDIPPQTNRAAAFQTLKVPLLELWLLGFVTQWAEDPMSTVPTLFFVFLFLFSDIVSLHRPGCPGTSYCLTISTGGLPFLLF